MQTVRKYLVYEYVPIMEKTSRSGTTESCVAQRSIYVILRGNEETRRYINQVRNVLRQLLSVIIHQCNLIKGTTFQTFFLYSSRPPRNSRFVRRLKSNGVKILKYFRNEFSGLKLTSAILRDKASFILHGYKKLSLLLQYVSFLCAEGHVNKD